MGKNEKTGLDKVMIIIGYIAVGYFILIFALGFLPDSNLVFEEDDDFQRDSGIYLELLEEDGYEVLWFKYFDALVDEDDAYGYAKMISLGNRNNQVRSALFSLSGAYPTAPSYYVRIVEDTQECFYNINGAIYRDTTLRFNAVETLIDTALCN